MAFLLPSPKLILCAYSLLYRGSTAISQNINFKSSECSFFQFQQTRFDICIWQFGNRLFCLDFSVVWAHHHSGSNGKQLKVNCNMFVNTVAWGCCDFIEIFLFMISLYDLFFFLFYFSLWLNSKLQYVCKYCCSGLLFLLNIYLSMYHH